MKKRALLSWGGWEGHRPEEYKDVLAEWLRELGFEVELSHDTADFARAEWLAAFDLIVPFWTLGSLTAEEERGLVDCVAQGTGLAGFHGMCGAFLSSPSYKWMTGGQLVAHPGDSAASYDVEIVSHHPLTAGIERFRMERTEQYYMHVAWDVTVLATTRFENGSVSPVAWITKWGAGRVFYISIGHAPADFDASGARDLLRRGLWWAAR